MLHLYFYRAIILFANGRMHARTENFTAIKSVPYIYLYAAFRGDRERREDETRDARTRKFTTFSQRMAVNVRSLKNIA